MDGKRTGLPVVVFDGDDTLWMTEPLYDAAREEARGVTELEGLDGKRWEALEREIDVRNVERLGLSSKRFPTSCVEAYRQICAESAVPVRDVVVDKIWHMAKAVFSAPAPLAPRAYDSLHALRPHRRLALLTQGDRTVQERRIEQSGLAGAFDEILIVDRKDANVLAGLLASLDVKPADAVMVGNSVPSDVNPALALGMRAVWIDAPVWEHERRERFGATTDVRILDSLSDLPELLLFGAWGSAVG